MNESTVAKVEGSENAIPPADGDDEIEESMIFEEGGDIDIQEEDDDDDDDGNILFVVSRVSVVEQETIPENPPDDL
ncbi:MAG: hypothetical protein SGARI_008040, partial [Bacillariaceae sp.]